MTPNSYQNPFWKNLAASAENAVGLPSGLLQNVVLKGERSNANQVSEAGAKTPFQIIPATRNALIDKYGIDPYKSPQDAAKGAALLLKESLDRNKGDIAQAVGEYVGGTDRSNWGPITQDYIKRVTGMDATKNYGDLSALGNAIDQWQKSKQSAPSEDALSSLKAAIDQFEQKQQPQTNQQAAQSDASIPTDQNTQAPKPTQEPSMMDKIKGGLETAASLATGAVTAPFTLPAGVIGGLLEAHAKGQLGTQDAIKTIEDQVSRAMGSFTYQPRTQEGQKMTQAVGEALAEALPPVSPVMGEQAALTSGLKQVAPMVTGSAQRVGQALGQEAGLAKEAVATGAKTAKEAIFPTKPMTEAQQAVNLSDVVKKAAGGGLGSVKAQEDLAAMAKTNPDAMKAAQNLGIDLPPDVFSDNTQFKQAVGLSRSMAGTPAESKWLDAVKNASKQADDVMQSIDAAPDTASVSDTVLSRLNDTRQNLRDQATKIYDQVDQSIPQSSKVDLSATKKYLDQKIQDVGVDGLNTFEKRLNNVVNSDQPITYGRLIREKSIIGDKLKSVGQLEGDLDTASAKQLYGALAQDQLDNVGSIGGQDLQNQLRGANQLYAQERGLSKRIVNAFGKDMNGSISGLMKNAISGASQGNVANLNKLLKLVPQDLQKQVLATAIQDLSRSKAATSATKGSFGFSEFSNLYDGLSKNQSLKNRIGVALGSDAMGKLKDLNDISKRVTEARSNVLGTGKSNQALVQALESQGTFGKLVGMLGTPLGRAVASGAGAAGGGVAGAALANLVPNLLQNIGRKPLSVVGDLFASEKFQKLLVEKAKGNDPFVSRQVQIVKRSPEFMRFAKAAKIPPNSYESVILSAINQEQQ